MRAYLLGTLSDEEADALETEYFVDRSRFLDMRAAEADLIGEYLDETLMPTEKQCFERRYLQVPDLRKRLEEIRRQRGVRQQAVPRLNPVLWRLAVAALLLTATGLGLWTYIHRPVAKGPAVSNDSQRSGAAEMIAVYLTPGQVKGLGPEMTQLSRPARDSKLTLILELPGRFSPVSCEVSLSIVQPDEHQRMVWQSPEPVLSGLPSDALRPFDMQKSVSGSTVSRKSQTLRVVIAASLLTPGDYVIRAWTGDHKIDETYVLRVTEPDRSTPKSY